MEIRLMVSPGKFRWCPLILKLYLFAPMLQLDAEEIPSVLGPCDNDSEKGDSLDELTNLLSFDGWSTDSDSAELTPFAVIFDEPVSGALVHTAVPSTASLPQPSHDKVVSSVAEILSEDSVSRLIKESLRSKVSSRVSTSPTAASEVSSEPCHEEQVPSAEDLERKAKRRKINREWAKKDRDRRRGRENSLQETIHKLHCENKELEEELSHLKAEARELRACWHLHRVFYH